MKKYTVQTRVTEGGYFSWKVKGRMRTDEITKRIGKKWKSGSKKEVLTFYKLNIQLVLLRSDSLTFKAAAFPF